MIDALGKIIDQYDQDVAFQHKRWGEASAARLAEEGIDPALICNYRTIHALADCKLIEITSMTPKYQERLRKGSFGKRLGGTVKDHYIQFIVKPTDAGRAARSTTL